MKLNLNTCNGHQEFKSYILDDRVDLQMFMGAAKRGIAKSCSIPASHINTPVGPDQRIEQAGRQYEKLRPFLRVVFDSRCQHRRWFRDAGGMLKALAWLPDDSNLDVPTFFEFRDVYGLLKHRGDNDGK